MQDYMEKPADYSVSNALYLIQKPEGLTEELIGEIYQTLLPSNQVISFEKLYKGEKRALVVYGSVEILKNFEQKLHLLELEDYTKKISEDDIKSAEGKFSAWEVGLKKDGHSLTELVKIDDLIPGLSPGEEFWWQAVLQPLKDKVVFLASLRAVLITSNFKRNQEVREVLSKFGEDQGLAVLPQAFTTSELIKSYRERALIRGKLANPKGLSLTLTPPELKGILSVS